MKESGHCDNNSGTRRDGILLSIFSYMDKKKWAE